MRDIRKPSRSSRSNINNGLTSTKKELSKLSRDVEMFEKNEYDDIFYDKNGKPIMNASSHFDTKASSTRRSKNTDNDTLDRNNFFNNTKKNLNEENIKEYKRTRNKKRKVKNIFIYIFLLLIVSIFLAWTFLFNSAKIIVNPKYKDLDVSDTFLFFKDDVLLDYASSSISKEIMKSEPKNVQQKATGNVTIYNNYSTSAQTLIKNTRIQTVDGKIFRLDNSIVIPGKNGNNPGSITTKVSADTYGADYNIDATTFTIPGFKDTARYTSFSVKSFTSMTGGALGVISTVSPEDIASTNNNLKGIINNNLSISLKKINHEDYFTLYKSIIPSYTDNQAELTTSNDNSYILNGLGALISIKKEVLAKMIAEQVLKEDYNPAENVNIKSIENLTFTIDPNVDLSSDVIKILITGKVRIIWSYNKDNITNSLTGQSVSNFSTIMNNYSNALIDEKVSLNPIWIKSFPNNQKRIKIEEVLK